MEKLWRKIGDAPIVKTLILYSMLGLHSQRSCFRRDVTEAMMPLLSEAKNQPPKSSLTTITVAPAKISLGSRTKCAPGRMELLQGSVRLSLCSLIGMREFEHHSILKSDNSLNIYIIFPFPNSDAQMFQATSALWRFSKSRPCCIYYIVSPFRP